MSTPLAAIVTNTKVVFIAQGQQFSVPSNDKNFVAIVEAVERGDASEATKLAEQTQRLKAESGGKAEIKDGRVFYEGRAVHNSIQERIEELHKRNFSYKRLLRFLEKVMLNRSPRAQQEIFPFLQNKGIPIDEDGNIIAYKVVTCKPNGELWDKHTGNSYRNNPGDEPFMERENTDDWGIDCGEGFHVGNLAYSGPNGSYFDPNTTDRIVLVQVNPKDIVSVPGESSSWSKFRCNTYKVLSLYNGPLDDQIYGEEKKQESEVKAEDVIKKLKKMSPKVNVKTTFKPGSWKDIVSRAITGNPAIKGKPAKLKTVYQRVADILRGPGYSLTTNEAAKVRQVLAQIAVKNDKGLWRLKP